MTTFDDRENAYENKFAHDQELAYKIAARRNKLLGQWAAEKMGLSGEEATAYAQSLLSPALLGDEDAPLLAKLNADLATKNVQLPQIELGKKIAEMNEQARLALTSH